MDKDIVLELDKVLKAGGKQKAEQFLMDNFNVFPEELKKLIVFTLVSEATQESLKKTVGDYIMQTAALQGLGEALEEVEKEK